MCAVELLEPGKMLSTSPFRASIGFPKLKAEDKLTTATATEICPLENYLVLPDHTMDDRIAAARAKLGSTAVILGHHYQRDEVIRFADFTGDSYKLAKISSQSKANHIIFC